MQVFAATLQASISPDVEWRKQNLGLPVVVCPDSAMHGWFSHSGSPQTKSSAVRA